MLIIEDGSIVAGAEAYIDVAYADTYHANRGNDAWVTLTVPQKEAAIRRATDYMGEAYRLKWAGKRVGITQALDWPRLTVPRKDTIGFQYSTQVYYDHKSIPEEVKKASAELALRAIAGDLAPDLKQGVRSKKIGPMETTYDTSSPQAKRYRAVDMMLSVFFSGGGATMGLCRV